MPTYNVQDTNNEAEFEVFMGISEFEKYLKDNPHLKQLPSSPMIGYSYSEGQKPNDGFRDVLRNIKSKHRGSTINTF